MEKRTCGTAQPIRKAKPATRVPTRLVNVGEAACCVHNDEPQKPHKLAAGTRMALLHSARRKVELDKAEAKANGTFLMKSTFGAVTTYEVNGPSGPPRTVLQVVDESYYRRNAQAPSKAASQGSSSSSRCP